MLGRRSAISVVAICWSMLATAGAAAQGVPEVVGPYDGQIPFRCELQSVGTGTDFPDPGADPFCVEFDKTNQNVTDFGIASFTAQEPARVAAAGTKCFYFQRDHWTGSIVQGSQPELWHWDGDYFFDRARGVGGASVRNFRVAGTPQDATPFVPPAYQPYFDGDGGGGVEVVLESKPDPVCAAKVDTAAERDRVYGDRGLYPSCIEPGGSIRGRRIGRVRIGLSRDQVLRRLGPPRRSAHRVDRWCLIGKGELRIGYGAGKRVRGILTSGRGQSVRGVARGDRIGRARRRLGPISDRADLHGIRVLSLRRQRHRSVWVGAEHGRVRWILVLGRAGIAAPTATRLIRHVR